MASISHSFSSLSSNAINRASYLCRFSGQVHFNA